MEWLIWRISPAICRIIIPARDVSFERGAGILRDRGGEVVGEKRVARADRGEPRDGLGMPGGGK